MLVSVTVITYNSSRFILETLDSIKNQTYVELELIVCDDCSTDNTIEVCTKWIEKHKGRFVSTKIITTPINTGIPANKNRGIRAASGEWIKSIAGDDTLVEDCIEKYIKYLNCNPDILVLHSNAYDFADDILPEKLLPIKSGSKSKINRPGICAEEQFQILLRVNKVRAGTAIIHKRAFEIAGYYDESIRMWEDRPMWLQMTKNGIKLHYLDVFTLNYRNHSGSVVKNRVGNRKIPGISKHKLYTIKEFNKRFLKYLPLKDRTVKLLSDQLLLLGQRYNEAPFENKLLTIIVVKLVNLSQRMRKSFQAPFK